MVIHLGRPLLNASCDTPGRRRENSPVAHSNWPSLLGLALGGVYHAALVTDSAVRSYRTLSPLPTVKAGGFLSVALSLGSPPPVVNRHRVSVDPGLSSTFI